MHIIYRAFLVALCATFSAPIQADDFISLVEENLPYQEVDEVYGSAQVREGRCLEGTPFSISQKRTRSSNKMDVARQIHERLRSLGANAFVITSLTEDTHVRRIDVTPLTCDLH